MTAPLSRRAALANIASAGALVIPTIAASAMPATKLQSLIDAHLAARGVLERATSDAEAAEPDGEALITGPDGHFYEARLGSDNIREYMERDFATLDGMTPSLSRLSPALGEEARALLEALKASCLASLEETFAAYAKAGVAWRSAVDVEEEAAMAICAHRCSSIEEAAVKFQYLFRDSPFKDELQPEHIEALAESFLPEGVGELATL
jgi:hypothetical protein